MTRLPAAQRREQLLDTAAKLFGEKGYSGSTTAELARAAGVTEPIIYRHFSSKKDLFIALLERTGKLTIQRWEQFLADAPDPAARLGRLIGANPMVIGEGRGLYRVVVQAMTEIDDEDILAALQNHIISLHKFLEGEIVKAQQAGAVGKSFSPEICSPRSGSPGTRSTSRAHTSATSSSDSCSAPATASTSASTSGGQPPRSRKCSVSIMSK
jgi:AcrR family transcriptional regulator